MASNNMVFPSFCYSSCGKVISGCRTNIYQPDGDGSGEILFWGRHVFMGYLNMEDKTQESIDDEGWLHSGDIGKHDDKGFLFITGRIKGDFYFISPICFEGMYNFWGGS